MSQFIILFYVNFLMYLFGIFSILTFYFNPEDTFWLCFIRDILAS